MAPQAPRPSPGRQPRPGGSGARRSSAGPALRRYRGSRACCTSRRAAKAGTRRPLLIVIHGGPTGVSRPTPFAATYVYPIEHWLAKGALVLEPNYRGSAGYGAAFRALNVRNLGVGDAWDVVSRHRVARRAGPRRPRRVSASWAGARAATSRRSSPRTRPQRFTRHLGGRRHLRLDDLLRQHRHHAVHAPVPEGDAVGRSGDLRRDVADHLPCMEVRTAPTLIQHGGGRRARADARTPTSCTSGLQDVGVPTRLAVYKGFGHSINASEADHGRRCVTTSSGSIAICGARERRGVSVNSATRAGAGTSGETKGGSPRETVIVSPVMFRALAARGGTPPSPSDLPPARPHAPERVLARGRTRCSTSSAVRPSAAALVAWTHVRLEPLAGP